MMTNKTQSDSHRIGKRRQLRMWWRSTDMRGDVGQALIELALTFPVFLLIIVGLAEFARVAYADIEVSNAARAGVAYGAQSPATAADTAGIELAATQDGSNITGLTATTSQFCSCSDAPSTHVSCSTAPATCSPAPVHSLQYVQVNTTATVTPLAHYPGLPTSFTLRGLAIMRVQQ